MDIAPALGLTIVTGTGGPSKDHIAESTGTGVAVLDYDQDGLPDLYFPNAPAWDAPGDPWRRRSGGLYRNLGGRGFTDVTEAAGVRTDVWGQGAVSGDFDGDGAPDLYITALGPNLLFRNNGDGTFAEVAASAGVAGDDWSIGATFLDADGDGFSDLFVANYIEASETQIGAGRRTRRWRGRVPVLDGPRGLPPAANRFYRADGRAGFLDETAAAGFSAGPPRFSMGVAAFDADGDGDPDLFVANDSTANGLWRNEDGGFRDVGLLAGAALSADGATQGSMGVAVADADGDGLPDLAVTNFAHDHYAFYRGLAADLFLDDAVGAGIANATFAPLGWGTVFFDAENDGDLDLAFANGHLYPQVEEDPALGESYSQPDQLFLREADGYRAGTFGRTERSSRGMALLDLEGDGGWEVAVSNQDAAPVLWRRRIAPEGSWIRFRLADPVGERDGLGARITLTAAGVRRFAEQSSGGSYASDNERVLHFGLGAFDRPVSVEVRWRDGATETREELAVRRTWLLKRGAPPIALPVGTPTGRTGPDSRSAGLHQFSRWGAGTEQPTPPALHGRP